MSQDYYSILGLARDATSQDIKRAFRQIARECHPDVAGADAGAEERFKQARQAYETLMDPVTRARYDRRGQRRSFDGGSFFDAFYKATGKAQEAQERPPHETPRSTYGPRSSAGRRKHDPGNDLDLEDLFNDFGDFGFGGAAGGRVRSGTADPTAHPNGATNPRPAGFQPRPGDDVQVDVEVPARIARDGGSVSITYHRMQRADDWRVGSPDPGVVRVQDIAEVRIIPGTVHGTTLRERGLGDAGAWGGPHGDLVARVLVVGSIDDERPGGLPEEPVVVTLDISVVEAILGGRVELDTPQGKVRLTVPAGTSSGARLRLKQKGPVGPGGVPADLYVELRIVVPRQLDEQSRRLIEEFAALNPWDPRS